MLFPFQIKVFIGEGGYHPSPGGPLEESCLYQIGFIVVFQGIHRFAYGDCQGFRSDWPPIIPFNDNLQDFPVIALKAKAINFEPLKPLLYYPEADVALFKDLGKVPHTPEEPVCHPGGPPA